VLDPGWEVAGGQRERAREEVVGLGQLAEGAKMQEVAAAQARAASDFAPVQAIDSVTPGESLDRLAGTPWAIRLLSPSLGSRRGQYAQP